MVRARELKFWENVHPPKHVMCHVSRVTCHVSHVTCHVSHVTCHMSHILFIFFIFWTMWWSLSVEGLLSTGPTPSSFPKWFSPKQIEAISFGKRFHDKLANTDCSKEMWIPILKGLKHLNTVLVVSIKDFHQIGPLGRFNLLSAMSVSLCHRKTPTSRVQHFFGQRC